MSQLGSVPFELLELKSRLRLYNEGYKYPPESTVCTVLPPRIGVGTADRLLDPKENDGTRNSEQVLDDDDDELDEPGDDDEHQDEDVALNREVLEAIGTMEDENTLTDALGDDDDDIYAEDEGTEAQKRLWRSYRRVEHGGQF